MCGEGPRCGVEAQDTLEGGETHGQRVRHMVERPRYMLGPQDALVSGQVMQMGAMEDGRCKRGLEGMGWVCGLWLGCM